MTIHFNLHEQNKLVQQWLAKGCVGPMIKLSHRLLYDVIIVKNGEVAFYNAFHFIARQLGFMFSLKQSYVNNNVLYWRPEQKAPSPFLSALNVLCSVVFGLHFCRMAELKGCTFWNYIWFNFHITTPLYSFIVLQVLFKARVGVLYQI